jgi:hypothetical protein
MPLAFPSQSHGAIAFGFFNIETDMLLLENLIFFADRFCDAIVALAEQSEETEAAVWMDGYRIKDPAMMGDLHGAIQGIDMRGFIGETYRQFPFPSDPKAFKQKPYGKENQFLMKSFIAKYGSEQRICLLWDRRLSTVRVEEFVFAQKDFGQLIAYVDRGGYPQWQDDVRPGYVRAMMAKLAERSSPLLDN